MGRAYTEEEKLEIKKRLWEEGLKLFHSDDHEELNIRELTQNAGISLGSFYNFYEDKGSFVREIMNYRAMQKLDKMKETFAASLKNPKEYLINLDKEFSSSKNITYEYENEESIAANSDSIIYLTIKYTTPLKEGEPVSFKETNNVQLKFEEPIENPNKPNINLTSINNFFINTSIINQL